jgi:hypothetical protein
MQNIKCELWAAANDTHVLKLYPDIPNGKAKNDSNSSFKLANIFQEIEYIADIELTIDVTGSAGVSPSINVNKYYGPAVAAASLPATGFLLSAGAQLNESSHRYIQLYSTADFGRMIKSEPHPDNGPDMGPTLAAPCPNDYEGSGFELAGDLGLKETLATGFIASAMDDVVVFPDDPAAPATKAAVAADAAKPKPVAVPGAPPPIATAVQPTPPQNVISSQVDFTIVESGNEGPSWTLKYFKGPVAGGASSGSSGSSPTGSSGGGGGLFNASRQVKDQLNITFVPVCVRQKYHALPKPNGIAWTKYDPSFVDGTPEWAHFLPACTQNYRANLANARIIGRTQNQYNGTLSNIRQAD